MPTWRARAEQLRTETYALYLAYRDPRVPWYARLLAALVLGYALSPLDLIPDFIPVLGYMDDLLLVPLGLLLAFKLIPPEVLRESRQKAQAALASDLPHNWIAAAVIVLIWAIALIAAGLFIWQLIRR